MTPHGVGARSAPRSRSRRTEILGQLAQRLALAVRQHRGFVCAPGAARRPASGRDRRDAPPRAAAAAAAVRPPAPAARRRAAAAAATRARIVAPVRSGNPGPFANANAPSLLFVVRRAVRRAAPLRRSSPSSSPASSTSSASSSAGRLPATGAAADIVREKAAPNATRHARTHAHAARQRTGAGGGRNVRRAPPASGLARTESCVVPARDTQLKWGCCVHATRLYTAKSCVAARPLSLPFHPCFGGAAASVGRGGSPFHSCIDAAWYESNSLSSSSAVGLGRCMGTTRRGVGCE